MIVRTLDEINDTDRDVKGKTWRSRRLLLADDGMGYSMNDTIIHAGTVTEMEYKHHLEAVYCVKGEGTVTTCDDDVTYEIRPGTIYALNAHDHHILRAKTDLHLVCTFNPPLVGPETHGPDGAYPLLTPKDK
ncbi:MAG: ectoine synthase [Myxococcales bacterium]|nr:ectoine synthase [Myxococcales bacterium]